jgi:hypothetical protein
MREAHRHDHAIPADATEPAGQMPEKHLNPGINASMVDDRHGNREIARPPECARHQPSGQVRIATEEPREPLVQHGEPRWLEHGPGMPQWQHPNLVLVVPRAEHIPTPNQLGAEAAVDPDPAHHQPVDHQHADLAGHVRPLTTPRPALEMQLPDRASSRDLLATLLWYALSEIRIFEQDVADAVGFWLHAHTYVLPRKGQALRAGGSGGFQADGLSSSSELSQG